MNQTCDSVPCSTEAKGFTLRPKNLDKLVGQEVEIKAAGLSYKGTLLGITAEFAFLKRRSGHFQVATNRITSIKSVNEQKDALKKTNSLFLKALEEEKKDKP